MRLHEVSDELVELPLPPGERHARSMSEGKANIKGPVIIPMGTSDLMLLAVEPHPVDSARLPRQGCYLLSLPLFEYY